MKQRLQGLLSEAGESFDYLRSDIRNLGRYLAELEELVEGYRAWASSLTLPMPADRTARRRLLKRTDKVVGVSPGAPGRAEQPAPGGTEVKPVSVFYRSSPLVQEYLSDTIKQEKDHERETI